MDTSNNNFYSLSDLSVMVNKSYPDREAISNLMSAHYLPAIMWEGFTEAQAKVISHEAYERGHSGGEIEQLSQTFSLCEFATNILKAQS